MSSEFDGMFVNLKESLCIWRIQNYNFSCLFNYRSPIFKVESLEECEWCLHLFVKHYIEGLIWKTEKKKIACQLSLEKCSLVNGNIHLNFWYELTNADGDFLRTSQKFNQIFQNGIFSEPCELIELDDLMKEMSNCPDDTLVLRCYMSSNFESCSISLEDRLVTCCEIETAAHLHVVPFEWHFKFSNFKNWSVIKNVCLTNISLEITFKYVIDQIQIEISSDIKNNCEHLFVCDIAILSSNGTKIVSYEHFEILHCNKVWRFPSFITEEHLEKAECFSLEEIRKRLRLTHPYSSTINYLKNLEMNKNIEFQNNERGCINSSISEEGIRASKSHIASDLKQGLLNLLVNKQFIDVELRVGDDIFPAHKLVLAARSPVFSTIFKQDMSSTLLNIEADKNTSKYFLEYIYTSEIQQMDEKVALNLLIIADKYQVLPLVEKCSKFLKSVLSLANVCKILSIADKGNHEYLKYSAVDFIVENSVELLSSPEWLQLIKINETLATVILFRVSNNLAKNKKEESMPGSSKEVSLPPVIRQQNNLDAGSSNSTMPEPEGRQMITP
ncbi:protein maternal effect lethal 26-like isoform X3 [Parasteatoda tepidariorum]|uniref:protein maternal effect lethal 26-like isoform X3 n=1 Tax=Parasteatoda tepidariorum TaxID=114398 RepID=UPI001C71C017|nr:protein maternal effect lethal 26-like isoform X3 [Parasteatoda tepidariorum]